MSKNRTNAVEPSAGLQTGSDDQKSAVIKTSFLIVPRFNMSTLITMIEPMRIANYLSPNPIYAWEILSFDGDQIAASNSYTTIYYPHAEWHPNWGGETVLFNADRTDITAAIYPRPGRLFTFRGTIPHVGRGVSRACPKLRVTLMFKTELNPAA